MRWFRSRCASMVVVVVSIGMTSRAALAQPLADRLPPETLVYAGWSPGASLQTTLPARMLADERFMRPWRLLLQQAFLAMPDEMAGADHISEHLPVLLTDIAQCEGAFALLELKRGPREWAPQAVLAINLGARRKSFEEHFKPIHNRLKDRLGDRVHMTKLENSWLWSKTTHDVPEYTWGFLGDSFVFYYGTNGAKFLPTLRGDRPAKSLKTAPNFVDTMAKIPGDSTLTSYIDLTQGLEFAHAFLKDAPNSDWAMAGTFWDKTTLALGLDNLRAWGQKTSIQDDQFITQSLLRTEGAPHGLLASLIQPAVDDAMLKAVPGDAMAALAVRLDLSKLYDSLKTAAGMIAGDDAKKAFGAFEDEAAGRGIPVAQLLAPLGDQWVVYNAASTGGFPFIGLTVVVDVRDPEKLHQAMSGIEKAISKALDGGNPGGARLVNYECDGVTIHCLHGGSEFSFFSPAYAVTNNRLVIAFYPQIVEDAVRQMTTAGKSLLDRPEFVSRHQQTGGGGPMLYVSEPELVKVVYPIVLPLISLLRSFGGSIGRGDDSAVAQEDLLPSMRRLLSYLADESVSVRLTPDGVAATRSVANPLLSPLTLVDSAPLWIAASLPVLAQAGVASDRARSMENLRRIGMAMTQYAGDAKKYPADIEALAKAQNLGPEVLKSPMGDGSHDYKYIYMPAGPAVVNSPETGGSIVLAYDAAELEQGDGCTALYADGHVEWLDREAAGIALKKAEEMRLRPKP